MADPAALADATPSDWTTPGFLADTTPAPEQPSLNLTDVAPAMRATPKSRDEPKEEAFDPDAFLASIKSKPLASAAPELKTGAPALQPVPEKDFDPDAFLASVGNTLHTTYDDKGNATGTAPLAGASPTQNGTSFLDRATQSLNALGEVGDPVKFLADAWTAPDKTTVATPAPPKLGTTSSPTANVIENADRSLYGSIGSAVQQAGSLLSRFDPRVDQTDDSTNPYIVPGLAIRDFANRNYITDPDRPYSGGAGNLLGNVLPVTATLGLGGAGEAATIAPKIVGGTMFGGQMYTGAADQGVSTGKAQTAGAVGLGLGALLPATRAFSAAPAIASATWGQLAKNVGYNALLNSSKTYWEMAGINWTSGEMSNSVLQPGQQQPQGTIAYNALADAFPMVAAGLATHGIEQASAEMNVNRIAKAQGQSKADFLMNTTQAMDAIANDPAKSPEEKMQAVTGFLSSFTPDAQKAITAHVQNIGATIDSIRAAADQAKALAPTNPQTAAALQKEQVDTAVAKMQTTATTIDQEADEAEKRAQEAFPEEKQPAAAPEPGLPDEEQALMTQRNKLFVQAQSMGKATIGYDMAQKRIATIDAKLAQMKTDRLNGTVAVTGVPEKQGVTSVAPEDTSSASESEKPEATPEPAKAAPEEQPVVQSPIPGGMTSDEYGALARHMENSPDPDIQARARELLQLRQQALQEHASTDSDARKTELEGEILAHEAALRKLSEEPQQEAPPVTPSAEPEAVQAPQHVTGYDEYGNPVYAETPPATEEKPAEPQPTAEAVPVAESPRPEQQSEPAAEGAAGVAEEHPAETAPAVEEKPPLTSTANLKRPALEKLALEEGHHPDDIKAAKTTKDLRKMIEDLREAKRVVGDKETSKDELEDGGMAADNARISVDPKIKSLPAKYRKAVEAFIKAAKTGKTWGTTKFVLSGDPRMGRSAMWAGSRNGFDTVYINPWEWHDYQADAAFNRKAFQEERLHNQAGYILNQRWIKAGKPGTFDEFYDKNFQAVHDQMSKTQRDKLQATYGVTGMHPVNIGEEYFRQTMQKAMGENLTEDEYNELAKRLRNNRPLRNIVQAVKDRLTAMVQKLTSHGVKDDELTLAEKKLDELMNGKKEASPPEEAKGEPATPGLPKAPETPEFKRWLGKSKITDEDGMAKRVYHVTTSPGFKVFSDEKLGTGIDSGRGKTGFYGTGFYFSPDADEAGTYASQKRSSATVPAYLRIENPLRLDKYHPQRSKSLLSDSEYKTAESLLSLTSDPDRNLDTRPFLRSLGYDGVIADGGREIVAFDPKQIKSALGNSGKFDPKNPSIAGLPPRPEEDDESKLWLSGDEGVRSAPVITPMKSPQQMAEYKPFVEEGQTAGELKPTGAEQLRSQRAVPAEAQEREKELANRARSLAHVDIPLNKQEEFQERVQKLARVQFSNATARDVAESNAFVKVMIEAKKWQEKNGTLDGFGSSRIIRNALLDEGRRAAHMREDVVPTAKEIDEGEVEAAAKEKKETGNFEPSTEGENEPQPKGYDASAQDYEEQQSQFEPVGQDSSQLATTETPAKRAQAAEVERNRQAIMDRISPYGRRLLEIWRDTPHDPSAAFAPWVSRAAKEFGLPRAKIMADFDAINTGLRREINQRGLTKEDLIHAPGLPPMRREGFAEQGTNDERLKENLRSVLASRVYEQKANQVTNDEANEFLAQHGDDAAYGMVMERLKTGRPTATDNAVAQKLILKLDSAPPEDGASHLKAAELATAASATGKEFGQFTQAFRMWSKLGANGVLEAYDKIIRPAIEGAKTPYKAVTDAIENTIKRGRQQAADEALDRLDKSGLTGKVDKAAAFAQEEAKPIWQRYMDSTAATLSRLRTEASTPKAQGALEEFAARLKTNLTGLMREMLPKAKGQTPEKLSATAKLGEVYKNMPEYQQAWDHARDFIKLKYADDPETLRQFEMAMNKAFEAPVKLTDKALDEQMKASGITLRDVAKQWADSQNATRDSLIKAITDKMGLSPEQAKAAGDAIALRFQDRLEAAKKNEVAKLLKQSGQNRLANAAPDITDKIFEALNLGAADSDVIWNAVAEKYGLPTYDKAVAQDLARRANEIQKYLAKHPEGGKISDDMTQDMMNVLANEAQKHMSYLRQVGEGEIGIFYGNIFGPSTIGRKSISEVLNLLSEVTSMAAVQMVRHGDMLAIPRAYAAILRGLYQRGGADARSIMMTGRGMRQLSGEYTADNLVERGKIFGNVPVLSKLNTPLSLLYKPVGRALYGAQAFFYAGAAEARATMVATHAAKQLIREGKVADEVTVNRLTQEILGNSPEMRQGFVEQAREEGLTGRAAVLRAQELAEQSRPEEIRQAAHDFAARATFMQEPEGVLGVVYRGVAQMTRTFPPLRLLVPVTRVVSNVFNNFLSYTPAGIGLPKFGGFDGSGAIKLAQEGKSDEMYQQIAKMTAGALGTIGMVSLFGNNIQGAGPQDYQKRKQLMDEGWIPFSVKVGNNHYSYREWPTALMMAGVGSYMDQMKYGSAQKDSLSRLALAFQASGRFALTSSWISSVNSLLDAFSSSNAESGWQSFLRTAGTTAGALVPFNQSTLKVIDKIFDPQLYPPNSVQGALMSQVAVARRFDNGNAPMLNALGDPVQSNPIQAFYSSTNPDPVWNALAEKNIFIPTATKAERVNGRPITNEEFYALTRDAGQATKETLMTSGLDAMAGMDQEQAQHYLSAIYRRNIDTVKAEIEASAVDAGQGAKPASRARRR